MSTIEELNIKIFADGADFASMVEMSQKSYIFGLTTNPSLMKKAGITDYTLFAKRLLSRINDKPISFEVISNDLSEMFSQAMKISSWANNVFVKIPVCLTDGTSTVALIKSLQGEGVKINVTAVMTKKQLDEVTSVLLPGVPTVISIFSGRIADTGILPEKLFLEASEVRTQMPALKLLWASTRQTLDIFRAESVKADFITVPNEILNKLPLVGKDLETYSAETVQMFYDDALSSGLSL